MTRLVQRQLDFTRGEQLSLRREIALPPGEKFLLWILDDHIGSRRSWIMSMAQLQEESGFSRSATYNYINRLCQRGLVWWDELPDNRRDFHICWSLVAEAIEGEAASTNPPGGKPVHQVESESTTWTLSPRRGRASPPGGLHISNSAPLSAPRNAPSTPSTPVGESAPDGDDDQTLRSPEKDPEPEDSGTQRRQILGELKACGVGAFAQCLELAEARGVTLDAAQAVLEVFGRHPGRWPPQVLFARLTKPEAALLAPDEGWYGELPAWTAEQKKRAWTAQQTQAAESQRSTIYAQRSPDMAVQKSQETQRLEKLHGEALDALTLAEAIQLLPADGNWRTQAQRVGGPRSPLFRPMMLQALDRKVHPVHVQPALFGEGE